MKRHLVSKSSMRPSDLPFLGAAIYRMSSWHLSFQCCVVRCLCPLSGHLLPAPSSSLPSSCMCLLPTIHLNLSSPPIFPISTSLKILLLASETQRCHLLDKVPLCQFLLLLLSMCVGYMRTAAGYMGVAKASDVFCASHLGGVMSMLHLFMLHPFLFLIYLGILAFILRIPSSHCCLKLCLSFVTSSRI